MLASRPLIRLEVTECFQFPFTVMPERFIMCVEKIIQLEITKSSLLNFTVELMPVKAVTQASKSHIFRYLARAEQFYVHAKAKQNLLRYNGVQPSSQVKEDARQKYF